MKRRKRKRLIPVHEQPAGMIRNTGVQKTSRAAAAFRTGIFITVLCLVPPAYADASPVYSKDTRKASIEDDADLFSHDEEETLLSEAASLSELSGYEIRLVTTDDTGGLTTRQYAEQSFEALTEDPPGKASGASYVIDMGRRNLYAATYGQLQYYLTDSRVESLLDDAYEAVSDQDYAGTFHSMLKDTAYWYRKGIRDRDGTRIYNADTGTYTVYHRPRAITAWKAIAALLASAGTFLAVSLSVTGSYSMRRRSREGYRAVDNVHLSLTGRADRMVNHFVTSTGIPRNSGGGPSGGVSTTHTTSGGYSSGGGGRSF